MVEAHERAVRTLSEKFGVSIARVEAIIRLKQYEQEYQKVRSDSSFRSSTFYEEYKSISLEDTYMVKELYAWLSDLSRRLFGFEQLLTRFLPIGRSLSHTLLFDMIIHYFCSSSASMRHKHLIYIA